MVVFILDDCEMATLLRKFGWFNVE